MIPSRSPTVFPSAAFNASSRTQRARKIPSSWWAPVQWNRWCRWMPVRGWKWRGKLPSSITATACRRQIEAILQQVRNSVITHWMKSWRSSSVARDKPPLNIKWEYDKQWSKKKIIMCHARERRKIGQIFQVFLWENQEAFPLFFSANGAGAHRSKKEMKTENFVGWVMLGWCLAGGCYSFFSPPIEYFPRLSRFSFSFVVVGGRCNMKIYRFSFLLSLSLTLSFREWFSLTPTHRVELPQAAKWMKMRLWYRNRKTAMNRGRRKSSARSLSCDMAVDLRHRMDPMKSPSHVPYLDAKNATRTLMASNTIRRMVIKRMESE